MTTNPCTTNHRHLAALIEPTDPNDLPTAPPEEDQPIHLRYLDVPPHIVNTMLTLAYTDPAEAHQNKLKALAKLNITPAPGETPFEAWVNTMARENGLQPIIPNPTIGAAAAELCPQWVWILA